MTAKALLPGMLPGPFVNREVLNSLKHSGGSVMREIISFIKFVIAMVLITSLVLAFFIVWILVENDVLKF